MLIKKPFEILAGIKWVTQYINILSIMSLLLSQLTI